MSMMSSGGKGSQDVDLNLAPIIDCLTVLVTFMLASATFLSVGVLDAGVGAAGEKSASESPPSVIMQAELGNNQELVLKLSGKANETIRIPAKQGEVDYADFKA